MMLEMGKPSCVLTLLELSFIRRHYFCYGLSWVELEVVNKNLIDLLEMWEYALWLLAVQSIVFIDFHNFS